MLNEITNGAPSDRQPLRHLAYFESTSGVVLPHSGLTTIMPGAITVDRGRTYLKQPGAVCLGVPDLNFGIVASVVDVLPDAVIIQAHERVRIATPLGLRVGVETLRDHGGDARLSFTVLKGALRQSAPVVSERFSRRGQRLIVQILDLERPRREVIDVLGNLILTSEEDRRRFLCAPSLNDRITFLITRLAEDFAPTPMNTSGDNAAPEQSAETEQCGDEMADDAIDLDEELIVDNDVDVDTIIAKLASTLPEESRDQVANLIRSFDRAQTDSSRSQLHTLHALVANGERRPVPPPDVVRAALNREHRFHATVVDLLVDHAVAMSWFETKGTFRRLRPLLLVGNPGLGKTEVARVFARALERPFASLSLGGVHDALAIAGSTPHFHNASTGGIVRGLVATGSLCPVFLLDEIDKMTATNHGDPAAVLLEVLGSNDGLFTDHFLGVPLNLTNVIWIATANSTETIHPALLDRMTVIQIPDYTEEQRLDIISASLIPRMLGAWSIGEEISFTPDAVTHLEQATRAAASLRSAVDLIDRTVARGVTALVRGVPSIVVDHEFVMQVQTGH
jgi:ATP-dependent Lon protease